MVQYNNMTSPGGIIYSRIADHFLILLAPKLGLQTLMGQIFKKRPLGDLTTVSN